MKKSYIDKKTGISYTLVWDIYIPNLLLPHSDYEIGICGHRYLEYIKKYRKPFYTSLKMQCKLNEHLHEIDVRTSEMYERLVAQLAEREGITEQLKAEDMMAWVQAMNNIINQAREVVNSEMIYTV